MSIAPLERECRVFTRYLTGQEPIEYVLRKYVEYHRANLLTGDRGFDRLLTGFAAKGPFFARLADSYASRFRKRAALRRKLVLLLALLECSPQASRFLDLVDNGSRVRLFLRLGWRGVIYASALLVSTAIFLPVHLVFAMLGKGR
jgi:hypothetical protein